MTPLKVRRVLCKFMIEVAPGPVNELESIWKETLTELSRKLSKKFKTVNEVEEYLDHTIEYIEGLNNFFVTQKKKSRIPYSKLFQFANKDERLSEYFFDKGVQKKFSKRDRGLEIAGHTMTEEEEEISIIFEDEVYSQIFASNTKGFFFSSIVNSLIVRNSKGKIVSYKEYKKSAIKKSIYYTTIQKIHKALLIGNRTETMESFIIHIRNLKNARKT